MIVKIEHNTKFVINGVEYLVKEIGFDAGPGARSPYERLGENPRFVLVAEPGNPDPLRLEVNLPGNFALHREHSIRDAVIFMTNG